MQHEPYLEQWGSCCSLISALNFLRYLGFKTTEPGAPDWDDYVDSYLCRYGSVIRTDKMWADLGICHSTPYHNDPVAPFEVLHFDDKAGYHSSLVVKVTRSSTWIIVNRSGSKAPLVQTVFPSELTLRRVAELTYVGDWRDD